MKYRQNLDGSRVALFSDCDGYRYELLIQWDASLPLLANIGLNPSTASHERNDPTVHRDIERAARSGYGALLKLNLFAIRATDPQVMLTARDPYGDWPSPHDILDSAEKHNAALVIAAWGNHGAHRGRSNALHGIAKQRRIELHAYRITGRGEPQHPLYLPYTAVPRPYQSR